MKRFMMFLSLALAGYTISMYASEYEPMYEPMVKAKNSLKQAIVVRTTQQNDPNVEGSVVMLNPNTSGDVKIYPQTMVMVYPVIINSKNFTTVTFRETAFPGNTLQIKNEANNLEIKRIQSKEASLKDKLHIQNDTHDRVLVVIKKQPNTIYYAQWIGGGEYSDLSNIPESAQDYDVNVYRLNKQSPFTEFTKNQAELSSGFDIGFNEFQRTFALQPLTVSEKPEEISIDQNLAKAGQLISELENEHKQGKLLTKNQYDEHPKTTELVKVLTTLKKQAKTPEQEKITEALLNRLGKLLHKFYIPEEKKEGAALFADDPQYQRFEKEYQSLKEVLNTQSLTKEEFDKRMDTLEKLFLQIRDAKTLEEKNFKEQLLTKVTNLNMLFISSQKEVPQPSPQESEIESGTESKEKMSAQKQATLDQLVKIQEYLVNNYKTLTQKEFEKKIAHYKNLFHTLPPTMHAKREKFITWISDEFKRWFINEDIFEQGRGLFEENPQLTEQDKEELKLNHMTQINELNLIVNDIKDNLKTISREEYNKKRELLQKIIQTFPVKFQFALQKALSRLDKLFKQMQETETIGYILEQSRMMFDVNQAQLQAIASAIKKGNTSEAITKINALDKELLSQPLASEDNLTLLELATINANLAVVQALIARGVSTKTVSQADMYLNRTFRGKPFTPRVIAEEKAYEVDEETHPGKGDPVKLRTYKTILRKLAEAQQ